MTATNVTVDQLADLLGQRGVRGPLIDVGASAPDVAAALTELGHEIVRCEPDPAAMHLLPEAVLGLRQVPSVGAVVLRRVLGRVPDPAALAAAARAVCNEHACEVFVVESNVAHRDVGAKLALGHWDVAGDGILGADKLHRFSAGSLAALLADAGFVEVANADVKRQLSDQHFPADAPEIAAGSLLASLLAGLREPAGDADTIEFVRAFAYTSSRSVPRRHEPTRPDQPPFLSVVVRTQGRRIESLMEALTCLVGQSCPDFETLLVLHAEDEDDEATMARLVDDFVPGFAARTRVIRAVGGGRARPLNTGLANARGRYLAFLDDDDLVMAHWVETIRSGADAAPGAVIRSLAATRPVTRRGPDALAPHEPVGGLEVRYAESFEVLGQLTENHTPIHTFAVPMALVRRLDMRFDEDLPVLEDWDFLMRCAAVVGVHDTGEVTAIYNWWEAQESSLHTIPQAVWEQARTRVVERLSARPLLLPAGAVELIDAQNRELRDLRHEYGRARADLDSILQSEWWRATAPMRRIVGSLRARRS